MVFYNNNRKVNKVLLDDILQVGTMPTRAPGINI